jgi:hypothetical protein
MLSPRIFRRLYGQLLDAAAWHAGAAQRAVDRRDYKAGQRLMDAAIAKLREARELRDQYQP